MSRTETILMLLGLFVVLGTTDRQKYIRLMKTVFPQEFKETEE